MSLLSEMREAQEGRKKPRCKVGILLAQMDEGDAAELREAFAEPAIETMTIFTFLRDRLNADLSYDSMRRHRKGNCGCPD